MLLNLGGLGDFGLQLLEDVATQAAHLEQPALTAETEQPCLPLALWIARNEGEIRNLAPVVRTLAGLASQTDRPLTMAQVCA